MARQIVAKKVLELVREDMKYDNNEMRGLSIFLGCQDIGNHLDTLSDEQRQMVLSYFQSTRDAAVEHLKTLGKLLSGYDESHAEISAFEIGWLVSGLAHQADAGGCIADLCEGANLLADIRSGKVKA